MRRNLLELWRYRALVRALVVRHLNARYRGSLLGFVWSFLNPLCLIAVYSLVFQYYIRFKDVQHYTLFLFAGLLPWIWFSSGLLEATNAISSGGSLITKAMFPPQILPTVAVLTTLCNFLFAVPLLFGFMLFTGLLPGLNMLLLPVVIVVELIFLLGLALAFSALNVRYRDVQHILGNLLTLWFFLCPILYPAENIPQSLRFTLLLNPVGIFTEMYQKMFLRQGWPSLSLILFTVAISCITLIAGSIIFNHYREEFAEQI